MAGRQVEALAKGIAVAYGLAVRQILVLERPHLVHRGVGLVERQRAVTQLVVPVVAVGSGVLPPVLSAGRVPVERIECERWTALGMLWRWRECRPRHQRVLTPESLQMAVRQIEPSAGWHSEARVLAFLNGVRRGMRRRAVAEFVVGEAVSVRELPHEAAVLATAAAVGEMVAHTGRVGLCRRHNRRHGHHHRHRCHHSHPCCHC
mmetsp:Transcript_18215/g.53973  ORF Transcript_18215/g.53973 Transcript_18215/m.53973 type:complete len:205 (-) Transcript_18215:14-628(-)